MPATAFDPMIKVNLMPCDIYTFDLREVMVQTGVNITEGLCVGILAWRAESKFLRFADEVAKVPRYRVKQGAYEKSEPLYQEAWRSLGMWSLPFSRCAAAVANCVGQGGTREVQRAPRVDWTEGQLVYVVSPTLSSKGRG